MKKINTGIDINQIEITSLSHIQGQSHVVKTLKLHLDAYFNISCNYESSNLVFGPVILTGPSGTGKNLVTKAIHAELGNLQLIESNGATINKKSELFSILLNADANTTIFIDEAQGMNSKSQHLLLTALSEKKRYVPAGISSANFHIIPLENFTMILATTHEYQLQDALRNRMRIYCRFDYYSVSGICSDISDRGCEIDVKFAYKCCLEGVKNMSNNGSENGRFNNIISRERFSTDGFFVKLKIVIVNPKTREREEH